MSLIPLIKRKLRRLVSDGKFSEILTGSLWTLGARILATALAMVSSIIIARHFGPEMMGILAVLNSLATLVTIFTLLGTNTSVLRLIPEHLTKHSLPSAITVYRKISRLVTALALATGLLLWYSSPLLAEKAFSKPHLTPYIALTGAFIWARTLMDFNTQALRALRLIRAYSFLQVLPPATMVILLIAGALLYPHDTTIPVYAQMGTWTLAAIAAGAIILALCRTPTHNHTATPTISLTTIINISLPMLLTASMASLISNTGTMLLGMLRPVQEVGYYSAAVKLSSLTVFVLASINSMAAPKFAELYHAGKLNDLFHVATKSTKLIFWTTTPLLLALITLGAPLLNLLYGPTFRQAYPALLILSLGQFINSISGSTGHFLNMTGNQKTLLWIMVASAIANLLVSAILIPTAGPTGAAAAAAISTATWNIASLHVIARKYGKTIAYLPARLPFHR